MLLIQIGGKDVSFLELGTDMDCVKDNIFNNKTSSSNYSNTRFIYHQIPERTFNIKWRYFTVFARHIGQYITGYAYLFFANFLFVQHTYALMIVALLLILTFLIIHTSYFQEKI